MFYVLFVCFYSGRGLPEWIAIGLRCPHVAISFFLSDTPIMGMCKMGIIIIMGITTMTSLATSGKRVFTCAGYRPQERGGGGGNTCEQEVFSGSLC